MSIISSVKQLIPGMFGNIDKEFAIHPNDEKRALHCLNFALYNFLSIGKFTQLFIDYLRLSGCGKTHIEEQVGRLKKAKFNPYNKNSSGNCWLISYEKCIDISMLKGERSLNRKDVINIVDGRKKSSVVMDFVNFYVSSVYFDFNQQLAFQQRNNDFSRSDFSRLYKNIYDGLIVFEMGEICIIARKIRNLKCVDQKNIVFQEIMFDSINRTNELHGISY